MTRHHPNHKCEFYPSASSSCLLQPTARLISLERGPLWLCVAMHLRKQDMRDGELRAAEMELILQEKKREWELEAALLGLGWRI